MATALKNLANELDTFIYSATQVNAVEVDIDFADESCIRGQVRAFKYLILVTARGMLTAC